MSKYKKNVAKVLELLIKTEQEVVFFLRKCAFREGLVGSQLKERLRFASEKWQVFEKITFKFAFCEGMFVHRRETVG